MKRDKGKISTHEKNIFLSIYLFDLFYFHVVNIKFYKIYKLYYKIVLYRNKLVF